MGHHLTALGKFKSDLHPELQDNEVAINLESKRGRIIGDLIASLYYDKDTEFAQDIAAALATIRERRIEELEEGEAKSA